MFKKISFSLLFLISFSIFSQSGSPYSFYGIGDPKFNGTIENRSMAGVAVVSDSIHLNLQNPAMLSGLKLTSFSLGGTYASNRVNNPTDTNVNQRTSVDYFAIGLPILNKVTASFGLKTFSSIGYKVQNLQNISSTQSTLKISEGKGGLNKVFLGAGFKANKEFSFGIDAGFIFGNIDTEDVLITSGIQYSTLEANKSYANGVQVTLGSAYEKKINKKLTLFSSATFTPHANLNLTNERQLQLVQVISGLNNPVAAPFDINAPSTKIKMPSKFTFGAGIGEVKKWNIATEISLQNFDGFGNRFNDITNVVYENGTKIAVGGYFIPNYNSFTSYFKRIVYRAGLRYENTGMIINNTKINDTGVTLGLGMPLKGTFSNLNLGLEYGYRGTVKAGLIRENYINFSIGLSFNDRWFVKSKIN